VTAIVVPAAARVLGLAGALACTLLLAGCDKPVPKVTVQAGSFSTTITPTTYCFDPGQCRASTRIDLPVVGTGPDAKVLVDVPRDVAGRGWSVDALTLDGKKNLGGSGPIRHSHSYRIASNANDGAPFIVAVQQLRKGKPDGSRWSFLVRTSATG
jgi:hypothetical protein